MSGLDLDHASWPVWHPVRGGPDLPCIATDGHGGFIRADRPGWWYRCNWVGQPTHEALPGVLKLRVPLGKGVMYTLVCAPQLVYEIPGAGTAYRPVTDIWEFPDGTVKTADTWVYPDGTQVTDAPQENR